MCSDAKSCHCLMLRSHEGRLMRPPSSDAAELRLNWPRAARVAPSGGLLLFGRRRRPRVDNAVRAHLRTSSLDVIEVDSRRWRRVPSVFGRPFNTPYQGGFLGCTGRRTGSLWRVSKVDGWTHATVLSQVQARPSNSDATERVIGSVRSVTEGERGSVGCILDPNRPFESC